MIKNQGKYIKLLRNSRFVTVTLLLTESALTWKDGQTGVGQLTSNSHSFLYLSGCHGVGLVSDFV